MRPTSTTSPAAPGGGGDTPARLGQPTLTYDAGTMPVDAPPIRFAPPQQEQDRSKLRDRLQGLLRSQIDMMSVLDLAFTTPKPGAYDEWLRKHVWTIEVARLIGQPQPTLDAGWVPARNAARYYMTEGYFLVGMYKWIRPKLVAICMRLTTAGIRAFAAALAARASRALGITATREAIQTFASRAPRWVSGTSRFALRRVLPVYLSYMAYDTLFDAREELILELVDAICPPQG